MEKKGLYHKYVVRKTDGSPVSPMARYLVLRLDTDRAARVAAMAYAEAVVMENPELACHLADEVRECGGVGHG